MNIISQIFIFISGTFFGSFFFTLALRYISGEIDESPIKALTSRSRCQKCGKKINPVFLIPLIGYIITRGRCQKCTKKISPLYPLLEIAYGLLALLILKSLGLNIYALSIYLAISTLITISIIDIKTLIIPDSLVILFAAFSIYHIIMNNSFSSTIYGFLLMFIFFLFLLIIFPGGIGGGDLKLASIIGMVLGLDFTIAALEIALISGSIIGIIIALLSGKNLKIKIPLGPFLAAGFIISLFYGRDILLLYYKLIY